VVLQPHSKPNGCNDLHQVSDSKFFLLLLKSLFPRTHITLSVDWTVSKQFIQRAKEHTGGGPGFARGPNKLCLFFNQKRIFLLFSFHKNYKQTNKQTNNRQEETNLWSHLQKLLTWQYAKAKVPNTKHSRTKNVACHRFPSPTHIVPAQHLRLLIFTPGHYTEYDILCHYF
jgi:hypothetical protein